MVTRDINISAGCYDCTFADAFGRGCKHGLMFPLLVMMSGSDCPNFEKKTLEQLVEQQNHKEIWNE